jgi:hypothetical protein
MAEKIKTELIMVQSTKNARDISVLDYIADYHAEAKQLSAIWESGVRVYKCEYMNSIPNQFKLMQDRVVRQYAAKKKRG